MAASALDINTPIALPRTLQNLEKNFIHTRVILLKFENNINHQHGHAYHHTRSSHVPSNEKLTRSFAPITLEEQVRIRFFPNAG